MGRAKAKTKEEQQTLTEQVLSRAGYRCENPLCRSKTGLQIHHIVKRSHMGPDTPENMVVLCFLCHRAAEDGRLIIKTSGDQKFKFEDTRRI